MPHLQIESVARLTDVAQLLSERAGFADIATALGRKEHVAIDGTWGSACALATAALLQSRGDSCPAPALVILPRMQDVDNFIADLESSWPGEPVVFPAWESLPHERSVSDVVFGRRLRVLDELAADDDHATTQPLIVTSLPAILQPVPNRQARTEGTRTLSVGEDLPIEPLLDWFVERGFDRVPAIESPGEFRLHGGILDVYPPAAVDPIRIEFFGDEIESIRRFDVETQRKLEDLQQVTFSLVAPTAAALGTTADGQLSADMETLLDNLPAETWIALVEMPDMVAEAHAYRQRLGNPDDLLTENAALARCRDFATVSLSAIGGGAEERSWQLGAESIERFTGPKTEVLQELAGVAGRDETVLLACHNAGEQQRLEELIHEAGIQIGAAVRLCIGHVAKGFRLPRERLIVISDHELFGRADMQRVARKKRRHDSRAIDSFLQLNRGDLVVHLTHGIGRFQGMEILHKDEQSEEHLQIEFADSLRIFVPVSLIHLVQKYVGAAKASPPLSKLGGKSWAKKKARVEQSVRDLATDMLQLHAAREAKPGVACPPDSHWQKEFAAAFPYTETDDQLRAIEECKIDLERARPMDRLICGDVGFGKTEVAMRAAFKMVDSGRQVAVLVPTTVLAEQHYRSFCERMAEFPVTIEVLSRFRSKAEQRRILQRMRDGQVDIVIGTHRIVQKDIEFKNLGLLVIDEEQRFGVEHKERLKQLRTEIDVLTLSATPIPRTLHLAVLGIRDISNLTTPPQERVPIETRITRYEEQLIRNAFVRELNRGGQVYFVHNRVYNIHRIADKLRRIVPEATIGVGHGQMSGDELEEVMFEFVSGRLDVLVATTIIESGLDIPNANTIFIHHADRFGLADLHQLRGRVGRYKHRAYCYLLLEEGKLITSDAAKRLKAIEEYSELGSGFRIAMRDLEIRGTGNILGNEQSGHIASVGYELYCQLLENAVKRLRNEKIVQLPHVSIDLPIVAYLPDDYVPPGRQKIEVYRRLSTVTTPKDLQDFEAELRDRFGRLPEQVRRLLGLRELAILSVPWTIDDIRLEDGFAVFRYGNAGRIRGLVNRIGTDLRVVDQQHAYLILPRQEMVGDKLLDYLRTRLEIL